MVNKEMKRHKNVFNSLSKNTGICNKEIMLTFYSFEDLLFFLQQP